LSNRPQRFPPSRERRSYLCGAIILCLGASGIAVAQDAPPVLDDIRFEGARSVSDAYLLSVIETRRGNAVVQSTIDEDQRRLLRTGKFATIDSEIVREDGRTILLFRLRERPTVTGISFQGNTTFNESALSEKVPIKPGDPVDLYALREGRENILYYYRSNGFGYASVEVDEEAARAGGEVVYRIEEGPKVRVREIVFEGNTVFGPRELKENIQTKTAWWIIREGAFDPDRVSADAAALQNFYRGRGYLDARVSYRVDPGEKPGDLRLVFTILENEPYTIETLRVEGNAVLTTDEVLNMMESRPGAVFNQPRLDEDVRSLQRTYGERGYIYADVRAVRVFASTPGFVIVTIEISEGDKMVVGRVVVRGNETTQDKVVRRALELYPGDTFNLTRLRDAEQALRQTQLFDRATITPVGDQPGVRDVVIDVTEAERRTDFLFAFGVTSDSGLIGSIVLDYKNFDIFDTPRSFAEFIKFRSFRGAGQRLRLELQPGTDLNRFRIDFTEPYLFDQPTRFDFSLFHFTRDREAYDEQRSGGNVSFGRRLENGIGPRQFLKDWYGEVSFGVENVDLDDVDIFDDRSIRDAEGNNFLTSAKVTLVRDRTDSRYLPTTGDRLSVSYEQFLGEWNFGKFQTRYTRHQTVFTDAEDRKSVFSFRVEAGLIGGTAPVFEKFYAGGIGSIRGFDFRGVGPRGGLEDDPIGGDFLLTTSAEYSFPLAGDTFRGVFFTDMGTVESDFELTEWRVAVGFGVRMTIELFGPVPIELDFAVPVVRDGDDETRVFSFFIGGAF